MSKAWFTSPSSVVSISALTRRAKSCAARERAYVMLLARACKCKSAVSTSMVERSILGWCATTLKKRVRPRSHPRPKVRARASIGAHHCHPPFLCLQCLLRRRRHPSAARPWRRNVSNKVTKRAPKSPRVASPRARSPEPVLAWGPVLSLPALPWSLLKARLKKPWPKRRVKKANAKPLEVSTWVQVLLGAGPVAFNAV